MKKLYCLLFILGLSQTFLSCSKDDAGEDTFVNGNSKLQGTVWTSKNWDYGIGDDWASILDETYSIYFYSSTEGVFYNSRRDYDTDFGTSRERKVAHFTYSVNENEIKLDYITSPIISSERLKWNGNIISVNGYEYISSDISYSDKEWISTLKGTTGACMWYHNLKNELKIVGKGAMGDYTSYSQTPWAKSNRTPNIVSIDDGVTSIGSYAFANPSIGEVNLPQSSINSIGKYAFQNSSISSIYLSDDIHTISEGAFKDCSYLDRVYLPSSITTIGDFAFTNCKRVSLISTKKLKDIGEYAFAGCTVTFWTDSEVLETIGEGAFTNCDFSKIKLPNSFKEIGHVAFTETGISNIHIGCGLTEVTGTPFYTSSRGKMYVDKNVPLDLTHDIIDPDNIGKWTLYVPKGCKNAYSKARFWSNFGSIIEDTNLTGN